MSAMQDNDCTDLAVGGGGRHVFLVAAVGDRRVLGLRYMWEWLAVRRHDWLERVDDRCGILCNCSLGSVRTCLFVCVDLLLGIRGVVVEALQRVLGPGGDIAAHRLDIGSVWQ